MPVDRTEGAGARHDARAPAESEPDVRFTFANERTFLAWNRTALALIATGVAATQLLPKFDVEFGRRLLGLPADRARRGARGHELPLLAAEPGRAAARRAAPPLADAARALDRDRRGGGHRRDPRRVRELSARVAGRDRRGRRRPRARTHLAGLEPHRHRVLRRHRRARPAGLADRHRQPRLGGPRARRRDARDPRRDSRSPAGSAPTTATPATTMHRHAFLLVSASTFVLACAAFALALFPA